MIGKREIMLAEENYDIHAKVGFGLKGVFFHGSRMVHGKIHSFRRYYDTAELTSSILAPESLFEQFLELADLEFNAIRERELELGENG